MKIEQVKITKTNGDENNERFYTYDNKKNQQHQ